MYNLFNWIGNYTNRKRNPQKLIKKIADFKNRCLHPEHKPPMHIHLSPGTYEHICPQCGHTTTFSVPLITL